MDDQKNHGLGYECGRKGVVNDVFENGHYIGNILEKYKENGQNPTFRQIETLSGLFYANFIA